MREVTDLIDESEALYQLVADRDDVRLAKKTQFKNWTINDVLAHLYFWNRMAVLSLDDEEALLETLDRAFKAIPTTGLRAFEDEELGNLSGTALREAWRNHYRSMADVFAGVDPKRRVKWAGPDMSVRSSVTARLMETWAHAQAVYDTLGAERVNSDRIRGIAVLGVNTFGWAFKNRGLTVPDSTPFVRLVAPSGEIWAWGEPRDEERIEGDAVEFCQVVTQTRNVADTRLTVVGDLATQWMSIAQCFAGPPENPPGPGTRLVVR